MKKYCSLLLLLLLTTLTFAQPEPKPTEDDSLDEEITKTVDSLKSLTSEFSDKFKNGNPLTVLPREDLAKIIDENLSHTPIGQMSQKNPKLKEMMLDFMLDEKALPGIANIFAQPGKLKNCAIVVGIIFVLSFVLGLFASQKEKLFERLWAKLFKWLLTMTAIWTTIYLFFGDELKPSIEIVLRNF